MFANVHTNLRCYFGRYWYELVVPVFADQCVCFFRHQQQKWTQDISAVYDLQPDANLPHLITPPFVFSKLYWLHIPNA